VGASGANGAPGGKPGFFKGKLLPAAKTAVVATGTGIYRGGKWVGTKFWALPGKVKLIVAGGVMGLMMILVLTIVIIKLISPSSPPAVVEGGNNGGILQPDTEPEPPPPPPRVFTPQPDTEKKISEQNLAKLKRATVHFKVTLSNGAAEGSGFFAGEKGIIFTNAHVLGMMAADSRPPSKIEITLYRDTPEEKEIGGKVLAVDRDADLAVVQATGTVPTNQLPPPLEVRPAEDLKDLQQLWVTGFSLGSQLGKAMSLSTGTVSALRKENGVLDRIQFNGNIVPGNSGGPVVNANCDLVGVSVAGVPGTSINFAVPGDKVLSLMDGRAGSITMGQPYIENGKTAVNLTLGKIDPMGKMRELAVDVWAGPKGDKRPPTKAKPQKLTGDTDHMKVKLDVKAASPVSGDVALPSRTGDNVYWVQPRWINGAGEHRWGEAVVWEMKSEPVERKTVHLQIKHTAGERTTSMTNKSSVKVALGRGMQLPINTNFTYQLAETTQAPDAQGGAQVRMNYREFNYDMHIGERVTRDGSIEAAKPHLSKLNETLTFDSKGQMTRNSTDMSRIPAGAQRGVRNVHQPVVDLLGIISAPMPNRMTQPKEKWTATRKFSVSIGPFSSEGGQVDATYTFIGTRRRNNREEAVIAVTGGVKGAPDKESNLGGNVNGVIVLDTAAGQIVDADVQINFDMDADYEDRPSKANGTLDLKLTRNVR
jgi:S1-C subfamily serine protease